MIYGLIVLFLLMWGLFIYNIIKNRRLEGFFYKGFTSLSFIAIGVYGIYHYVSYPSVGFQILLFDFKYLILFLCIILGLVSGLVGDLFLEVQYFYFEKREYTIKKGMIAFGIGHFFYITGMSYFIGFNYYALLIGALMTLVVYLGGKIMKLEMKKLEVMTYIYTFIIFVMVGLAVLQAFKLDFNGYSLSFMIGALFFGLSDLILAPIYFKNEKSHIFTVANLATYYLGQVLIALSILFL